MHYDLSRKSGSTTKEQIYTYPQRKENNYDNPRQTAKYDDKSYPQRQADKYDDKSYPQRKSDKYDDKSYPQRKADKYDDKSYPQRKADKYEEPYNQYKKYNYDNPRQDYKSYHQQKAKPVKQEKTRSVYKFKIERDESGNCKYVLEDPIVEPNLHVNYREFVCVYPSNGTKYYKNVNIYNYKKQIII
jgi:hypothetical protein